MFLIHSVIVCNLSGIKSPWRNKTDRLKAMRLYHMMYHARQKNGEIKKKTVYLSAFIQHVASLLEFCAGEE